ncbi:hypothetical protein BDW67DRAFT_88026 [Aspergillus spinulosporus]
MLDWLQAADLRLPTSWACRSDGLMTGWRSVLSRASFWNACQQYVAYPPFPSPDPSGSEAKSLGCQIHAPLCVSTI